MTKAKRIALIPLSIFCLSAGLIAILLERQAHFAQIRVKNWAEGHCVMEELQRTDESFIFKCTYKIGDKNYEVSHPTPIWNTYFDMLSGGGDEIKVFYIDSEHQKNRFQFKKGASTLFWYDPKNPEDSVLMPGAGSLTPFLYFGIAFYALLFLAVILAWKKNRKNLPPADEDTEDDQ